MTLDGLYSERDKRRVYGQAHSLDNLLKHLGEGQKLNLNDPVNEGPELLLSQQSFV